MSNRTWLIVDGNNIAFRGSSVIPPHVLIDDSPNCGLLWGMFNKMINRMHADGKADIIPLFTFDAGPNVNIANDAKINRWTYDTHYKENRRDDGSDISVTELEHARRQWRMKWIDELMDAGYAVTQYANTEADDIIAYCADNIPEDDDAAIWTMDKDLMQCVDDNAAVWIYRYRRGLGDVKVDSLGVKDAKGVPPEKIRLQLTVQGDASDNYSRVPGYGGKKGLRLVNEADGLNDVINALPKYENQLRFNWNLAGCGLDYLPTGAVQSADYALAHAVNADRP